LRYQLYFGSHAIAVVKEKDADFPTYFGEYRLLNEIGSPELGRVRDYIDYSVRVWPQVEQDRMEESSLAEEETFMALIESEDWFLVEADSGRRIRILIPLFCTGNRMNWRLNPVGL
jgi:hypothetical protein